MVCCMIRGQDQAAYHDIPLFRERGVDIAVPVWFQKDMHHCYQYLCGPLSTPQTSPPRMLYCSERLHNLQNELTNNPEIVITVVHLEIGDWTCYHLIVL